MLLAGQGVPERRIHRGFRPDDLDRGLERARRHRVAGDQSAAADRDHQHVEIGNVLQHFRRDRPLPGDHADVVIGMNPGEAALVRQRLGFRLRLDQRLAFEHDRGPVLLRRFDLHGRRGHRHDDGGGNVEPRRVVGDRLGVVAGGHGDDAGASFLGRERGQLVERAALLERVGDLEILVFDVDVGPGERRKPRRRQHRRAQDLAGNGAAGGFDVGGGDGHGLILVAEQRPAPLRKWPATTNARASCPATVYSPSGVGFEHGKDTLRTSKGRAP